MTFSDDDPRLQAVGYAKIVGEGVEHVLHKYSCVIGRRNKSKPLDVALDLMSVSREHAKIAYNFKSSNVCTDRFPLVSPSAPLTLYNHQSIQQSIMYVGISTADCFELTVLGKNGLTVNAVQHNAGETVPLSSPSHLKIGTDVSLYFLLPRKPEEIYRPTKRIRKDAATAPAVQQPPPQQQQPASIPTSAAPSPNQQQQQPQTAAAATSPQNDAVLLQQLAQLQSQNPALLQALLSKAAETATTGNTPPKP